MAEGIRRASMVLSERRPPAIRSRTSSGNAYLPTMMGNAGQFTPQKGQWAFCHAVYPGQIFAVDDPLAAGQMAMLRATKVEGHGLRHRLDEGRPLDLFCLVLWPRRALDGTWQRSGSGPLRLRQPCRPDPRLARGAEAAGQGRRGSRRHAAQLGQRRVHPPGRRTFWNWIAATSCICWRACPPSG